MSRNPICQETSEEGICIFRAVPYSVRLYIIFKGTHNPHYQPFNHSRQRVVSPPPPSFLKIPQGILLSAFNKIPTRKHFSS